MIGNGVVIHPPALLKEIETLAAQGVDVGRRLHISDRAHVILPYHLEEERLTEESASQADHLGTTRRGIGPCYRDKVGRVHGVRVADLYHPGPFRERLRGSSTTRTGCWGRCSRISTPFDAGAVAEEYLGYAERLRPFVRDTTVLAAPGARQGRRLLFEGAQGSLLDVDHGSYPYVTSSNSSAAGIAAGRACRRGTSIAGSASSRRTRRGWAAGRFPPSRTTRSASGSAGWARSTGR